MRTTINIDDELFREASEMTGIKEKTRLLNHALQSVIAREAGKRLALLGGTMPDIKPVPRRRSKPYKKK